MSAILKMFSVELTRNQTREINEHLGTLPPGIAKYWVIAQTQTKFTSSINLVVGGLNFAVLSNEAGEEIAGILKKHRTNLSAPDCQA